MYICVAKWMYFRRNILWKAVLLHVLPLKWFFVFTFSKKVLTLCTSNRWLSIWRTCSMFTSLIFLYFPLLNRVLNFKTKKFLLYLNRIYSFVKRKIKTTNFSNLSFVAAINVRIRQTFDIRSLRCIDVKIKTISNN